MGIRGPWVRYIKGRIIWKLSKGAFSWHSPEFSFRILTPEFEQSERRNFLLIFQIYRCLKTGMLCLLTFERQKLLEDYLCFRVTCTKWGKIMILMVVGTIEIIAMNHRLVREVGYNNMGYHFICYHSLWGRWGVRELCDDFKNLSKLKKCKWESIVN